MENSSINRQVYWIWLTMVFGAGDSLIWELCQGYKSIIEFAKDVRNGKFTKNMSKAQIRRSKEIALSDAAYIFDRCEDEEVSVLNVHSEDYPERFKKLKNPPAIIYARGDLSALKENVLLVVGTHDPSVYSTTTMKTLCQQLVERGVTIISGFEKGIDQAANEVAVNSGGKTVGICGRGIFSEYYNKDLCRKVIRNGCLISEYTEHSDYGPVSFDKRNRLLCGVSDAILFIECREDSTGLNNVRHAKMLGKPVLALPPADIFDGRYLGQRNLIRGGARCAFDADDILDAMVNGKETVLGDVKIVKKSKKSGEKNSEKKKEKKAAVSDKKDLQNEDIFDTIDMSGFTENQVKVCELLKENGAMQVDQITEQLEGDVSQIMAEIMELRILLILDELPGKFFKLAARRS